ncbi:MAG: BatA and WFA domain-containing protein [Myxococcota bacterium]
MQGLSVAHPWLLVGLAGAALPMIIHLIGRRRAPVIAFGAFDFLVAANRRLARRERLRQILLLIARTLAIVVLVLALARPRSADPAVAADAQRRLALIVDASGSMAYERHGTSLLDAAKGKARDLLTHLQPGDAATLIVAGAEVRQALTAPTADLDGVRRALDDITTPAGVADMGAAIAAAIGQLGADPAGAVLVIVTDASRNSFAHLVPSSTEHLPRIEIADAAGRDELSALANAAVTHVVLEPTRTVASEHTFRIEVHNYGAEPLARVPLQLSVDGQVTQRLLVDVGATTSTTRTLTTSFAAPGVYRCAVTLADPGGYHVDDVAYFLAYVEGGVRLLLVDGDPSATPYDDELFFAHRALEVLPLGAPPIQMRTVTPSPQRDANLEALLPESDAVLLANVGDLADRDVQALRRFVARGGGILWTLGDKVAFERANERFGDLLPYALRDLHRAADPAAGTPALGIGEMDSSHPIFAGLGTAAEESLHASRTERYFNLDVGSGLKVRTLLRFDNGAPALVERATADDGRSLALLTSIDVDMSDLALRSAFPPLLQRAVRYLAGAVEDRPSTDVRVGATLELPLPTGASEVRLVTPTGVAVAPSAMLDGHRRARFDALPTAGFYDVQLLRPKGWQTVPSLTAAIDPSLEESDFAPFPQGELADALGAERTAAVAARWFSPLGEHDPLATRGWASVLLAVLALLFIGESLLALRG